MISIASRKEHEQPRCRQCGDPLDTYIKLRDGVFHPPCTADVCGSTVPVDWTRWGGSKTAAVCKQCAKSIQPGQSVPGSKLPGGSGGQFCESCAAQHLIALNEHALRETRLDRPEFRAQLANLGGLDQSVRDALMGVSAAAAAKATFDFQGVAATAKDSIGLSAYAKPMDDFRRYQEELSRPVLPLTEPPVLTRAQQRAFLPPIQPIHRDDPRIDALRDEVREVPSLLRASNRRARRRDRGAASPAPLTVQVQPPIATTEGHHYKGGRPGGQNSDRDNWIREQRRGGKRPAEITRLLGQVAQTMGWETIGRDRVKQILREG
jgi:hypothetical protein